MAIKNIFADVNQKKQLIENLTIDDLTRELEDNADLLLIDLRELQERVDLGAIPGSKHVPRGMLEFWADPSSPYFRDYFQEQRRTIVFCAGGGRSVYAAIALQDMGFTDVAHVEEGFRGWQESSQPIEDIAGTSRWVRREAV
jgi:rhodanese-related sulfurtransferase